MLEVTGKHLVFACLPLAGRSLKCEQCAGLCGTLPVLLSGSFQGSLEGFHILLVSVRGLTLDSDTLPCLKHIAVVLVMVR